MILTYQHILIILGKLFTCPIFSKHYVIEANRRGWLVFWVTVGSPETFKEELPAPAKPWYKQVCATSHCGWWVVASWWVVVYRSTAASNKSSSNGSFKYKNFECSSVSSRSFRYVKTTKWWLQCRHAVNEYLASRLVNQKMTSIAQMRASNMLVPPKSHHLIVSPILFESFFVSLFRCNYFLLKTLERWKRYYEM